MTLNNFKMHSIYAIVSAKKKNTYALLLRDLTSSEKNKKKLWSKSVPLQVVQKKSASQHKKSWFELKGLKPFTAQATFF